MSLLDDLTNSIGNTVNSLLSDVGGALGSVGNSVISPITSAISQVEQAIVTFISEVKNEFESIITDSISFVSKGISAVINQVSSIFADFTKALDNLENFLLVPLEDIATALGDVGMFFGQLTHLNLSDLAKQVKVLTQVSQNISK